MNVMHRDVEGVAEAHEAGALHRRVDVEHARQRLGLVADDADRAAVQPREADRRCSRRSGWWTSKNSPSSTMCAIDVAHVVGLRRVVGDDVVQLEVHPLGVVGGLEARRLLEVVERQEAHQVAHVLEALVLALGGEVRDARLGVVRHRAAELLEGRLLAGHRLDHIGARDEHVRGVLHHEDEVRHRRRVDGAAGAGAHDDADLRDHARSTRRCARRRRRRRPATRRPPGSARRRSR